MVKPWAKDLDKLIKITQARIKHHEKHGCGKNVIQDKAQLVKMQHTRDVRLSKK